MPLIKESPAPLAADHDVWPVAVGEADLGAITRSVIRTAPEALAVYLLIVGAGLCTHYDYEA
eukprot:6188902-Pleurochrysis_carterae.AAC.2